MIAQLTEKDLGIILFKMNSDKIREVLEGLNLFFNKDELDNFIKKLEDSPVPESYWY